MHMTNTHHGLIAILDCAMELTLHLPFSGTDGYNYLQPSRSQLNILITGTIDNEQYKNLEKSYSNYNSMDGISSKPSVISCAPV